MFQIITTGKILLILGYSPGNLVIVILMVSNLFSKVTEVSEASLNSIFIYIYFFEKVWERHLGNIKVLKYR